MKIGDTNSSVELWMIRHGETIFNRKNMVQGWCDSPLTENGVFMTACLGTGFKNLGIKFDAIYSSDLTRCLNTSKILREFMDVSLNITVDQRLREINTGDGEGDNIESHLKKYPYSLNFKKHGGTPNGETWDDVYSRLIPAIEEIVETHKTSGGKILVVTHSMVISSIMGYLDSSIENVVGIPNNSVTVFKSIGNELKLDTYANELYIQKGMTESKVIKSKLSA